MSATRRGEHSVTQSDSRDRQQNLLGTLSSRRSSVLAVLHGFTGGSLGLTAEFARAAFKVGEKFLMCLGQSAQGGFNLDFAGRIHAEILA